MPNLTNLLPASRLHSLKQEYWLRLVTVLGVLVVIVVVVHGALLVPAYLYLSEEVETRTAHLASISSTESAAGERPLGEREAQVAAAANDLAALVALPDATSVVREFLALPHESVRITGVSVTPPSAGKDATMSISGVAATRESLRRYRESLAGLPFVAKADLPLSVYAAEADLPFTISLTGKATP